MVHLTEAYMDVYSCGILYIDTSPGTMVNELISHPQEVSKKLL